MCSAPALDASPGAARAEPGDPSDEGAIPEQVVSPYRSSQGTALVSDGSCFPNRVTWSRRRNLNARAPDRTYHPGYDP